MRAATVLSKNHMKGIEGAQFKAVTNAAGVLRKTLFVEKQVSEEACIGIESYRARASRSSSMTREP